MNYTWLDFLLAAVMIVTVIVGLYKGLIREVLGVVAAVLGLILAGQYYENLAAVLRSIITAKDVDAFVSFIVIFLVVMVVGYVIGALLSRAAKGPLKFFNHVLGGVFGIIKGFLVCGVVVLALIVFSIDRTTVTRSVLAPYALTVTNSIVRLVPQELKAKFRVIYEDIKGKVGKHGEKD